MPKLMTLASDHFDSAEERRRTSAAAYAWNAAKELAKKFWFADGSVRRSLAGPYRGLTFVIGPQMRNRMVVFYSAYEREVSELITRVSHPGMVACVCGAHVGIHTLHLARLVGPAGLVYAFEPWPANFAMLTRNIAGNQALTSRVVAVPQAVGAASGTCAFSEGRTDGTHHVTRANDMPTTNAAMTTLDAFCKNIAQPPSLLLIDVEGEELNLIEGASDLLRSQAPALIMEHHGDRKAQIVEKLTSFGYEVRSVGARHVHAQRR